MCHLRAWGGCALCLSKYLVLEGHVKVISGGYHFPSLNLDLISETMSFFLFVFPNAGIIPSILRWMEFLFLAHSSGHRGVLRLDRVGAKLRRRLFQLLFSDSAASGRGWLDSEQGVCF